MLLWPTVLGITNSDMVTLWICWRFITVFERWKRTRPSKQCKSLIWILIFVFPVLICYRKRRLWQLWQIFNYAGNFSSCGQYSSITLLQLLIRWSVCWKMLVIQRTVLFANDHLQRNRGARRRPDRPDGLLQQSVLLRPFDFGHPENRPLCKWPFAKEGKSTEEAKSSRWSFASHWYLRHWYMMVLGQYRPVLAGIWWYWVSMGQYWLVLGDTGSV